MTIADLGAQGKALIGRIPRDAYIVTLFVLGCSASFGLGLLTGQESGQGSPFSATSGVPKERSVAAPAVKSGGEVVASKNGTRYYFLHCAGVSRISATNKVTFPSPEVAEAKGYTLATGCK